MNPESIWAKAGICTGDRIISADEGKISTWQDFRGWLGRLKIGDTARLIISRKEKRKPSKCRSKVSHGRSCVSGVERGDGQAADASPVMAKCELMIRSAISFPVRTEPVLREYPPQKRRERRLSQRNKLLGCSQFACRFGYH